jgi:hypothetical protein
MRDLFTLYVFCGATRSRFPHPACIPSLSSGTFLPNPLLYRLPPCAGSSIRSSNEHEPPRD